ncbi:MAG TPA: pilus assembly protein N-terminal domain-containing protein [Rhizomicrobium sp.]|nr:pilus assembly protein N-terminal domain-containing protein [Rhizomicrobium sp.]
MRPFRIAFLAASSLLAASSIALAAHAAPKHAVKHVDDGLVVAMDEARMLTFTQPIVTLFLGNTTIADVTIIDSHHAYLLGKTFGTTNMIGLDSSNHQVMNAQVHVINRITGSVTLNRGAASFNYSCTALHCETGPRPGDPADYVANTEGAAQAHEGSAAKAAVASNQ